MTISNEEIEIELGKYLDGMTGKPAGGIAWQNKDVDPERPFLAADHVPGSRTDPTLDGNGETVLGQFMVYVVVERGTFTKTANNLADLVMQRFKYMTLIPLTNGGILIVKPPEVLPGYRDGPDWRTPVRIDYEIQT